MSPSPVRVRRAARGSFVATNARGAEITIGRADAGAEFSPVELLLAALGSCAGLSADNVIARRLGADAPVEIVVEGDKDDDADRLTEIRTRFDLDVSALTEAELAALVTTVTRAVERTCTVSRTVEPGVPVKLEV